jgi:hypothetical protein
MVKKYVFATVKNFNKTRFNYAFDTPLIRFIYEVPSV